MVSLRCILPPNNTTLNALLGSCVGGITLQGRDISVGLVFSAICLKVLLAGTRV